MKEIRTQISRLEKGIALATTVMMTLPEDQQPHMANEIRRNSSSLTKLRTELASLTAAADHPVRVPDIAEVRDHLNRIAAEINGAISDPDPDEGALDLAYAIFREFTRGRINVHQEGERTKHRGQLRGTFLCDVARWAAKEIGGVRDPGPSEASEVSVDFVAPSEDEALARKVIDRRREGITFRQIAAELGIGRNRASQLERDFAMQFAPELVVPRGKRRKHYSGKKRMHEQIADEVMKLASDGKLLGEIGDQLQVSSTTITAAVHFWFESRGLTPPDGRTFRRMAARGELPAPTIPD